MDKGAITQKVLGKALSFLGYRVRTRKELDQRIDKYLGVYKALSEVDRNDVKSLVLVSLEEEGLIDDKEFARIFIESKTRGGRVLGRRLIENKLVALGVEKDVIAECLNNKLGEDGELEGAVGLVAKKYKAINTSSDFVIRAQRYLMSRGFSYSIAKQAVDYLLKRP